LTTSNHSGGGRGYRVTFDTCILCFRVSPGPGDGRLVSLGRVSPFSPLHWEMKVSECCGHWEWKGWVPLATNWIEAGVLCRRT
jgi:hypothetical protein